MTVDKVKQLYVENLRDALDAQLRLGHSVLKLLFSSQDENVRRAVRVRLAEVQDQVKHLRALIDDMSSPSQDEVRPTGARTVFLFSAQGGTV
ncbi:MAG: hypothetical protein JST30_16670 [Armatimonadetes bacterium]|nr:hypothetical protein [Armatimonadota bacterium]